MVKINYFNQNLKNYFYSLKYFILFSFLIFVGGIVAGYFFPQQHPVEAQKLLEQLKEIFHPMMKMSTTGQVLFVFLQNSVSSFFAILGGIVFGIFPILSIVSNGEILGLVSFYALQKYSIFKLTIGILPHGFLEIPALLISVAMGLKIGRVSIQKIINYISEKWGREVQKPVSLRENLSLSLELFLKLVLVLLVLAAIMEVLVSSRLLEIAIF